MRIPQLAIQWGRTLRSHSGFAGRDGIRSGQSVSRGSNGRVCILLQRSGRPLSAAVLPRRRSRTGSSPQSRSTPFSNARGGWWEPTSSMCSISGPRTIANCQRAGRRKPRAAGPPHHRYICGSRGQSSRPSCAATRRGTGRNVVYRLVWQHHLCHADVSTHDQLRNADHRASRTFRRCWCMASCSCVAAEG